MSQSSEHSEVADKGDELASKLARALLAAVAGGVSALAVAYACHFLGVSAWNPLEPTAWSAASGIPVAIFALSAIGTAVATWLMQDLAQRFAIAAAGLALGALLAIALQYVIVAYESAINWIGGAILLLGLGGVFARAIVLQGKERRRKTFRELLGKSWAGFVFAAAGALAVCALFLPYVGELLHGPLLAMFQPPLGDRAGDFELLAERTEKLWTVIGALASVVVAVAVADTISPKLKSILDVLGLSDAQISLAKRMLLPVKGAVPKGKHISQLYAKEVQINRPTLRRQFPLVTGSGEKARVKLIIDQRESSAENYADSFDWTHVDGLLKSADIELTQCLFFVCTLDEKQRPKIICYGTGAELKQLFEATTEVPHRLGRTRGEEFVRALNRSRADEVIEVVKDVRKDLLKRHPHAEVLLSTTLASEKDSVQAVLKMMEEDELSRILVTSDKAPLERGIVGAAELTGFLLGETDAAA